MMTFDESGYTGTAFQPLVPAPIPGHVDPLPLHLVVCVHRLIPPRGAARTADSFELDEVAITCLYFLGVLQGAVKGNKSYPALGACTTLISAR
jgi:hypothetical protein